MRWDPRRDPRVPFSAPVTLVPLASGDPVEARSLDLGPGGVRLITVGPVALAVGQPVAVTFHLQGPAGGAAARETTAGRIAHARPEASGTVLGVAFLLRPARRTCPNLARLLERP